MVKKKTRKIGFKVIMDGWAFLLIFVFVVSLLSGIGIGIETNNPWIGLATFLILGFLFFSLLRINERLRRMSEGDG